MSKCHKMSKIKLPKSLLIFPYSSPTYVPYAPSYTSPQEWMCTLRSSSSLPKRLISARVPFEFLFTLREWMVIEGFSVPLNERIYILMVLVELKLNCENCLKTQCLSTFPILWWFLIQSVNERCHSTENDWSGTHPKQ